MYMLLRILSMCCYEGLSVHMWACGSCVYVCMYADVHMFVNVYACVCMFLLRMVAYVRTYLCMYVYVWLNVSACVYECGMWMSARCLHSVPTYSMYSCLRLCICAQYMFCIFEPALVVPIPPSHIHIVKPVFIHLWRYHEDQNIRICIFLKFNRTGRSMRPTLSGWSPRAPACDTWRAGGQGM